MTTIDAMIIDLIKRLREVEPGSKVIIERCNFVLDEMKRYSVKAKPKPLPTEQAAPLYWNSEVGFIEAQTAQPSRPEWRQSPGDFYGVPTMSAAEMLVKAAEPDGLPDAQLKPGEF